jgi:hypothetical protein
LWAELLWDRVKGTPEASSPEAQEFR